MIKKKFDFLYVFIKDNFIPNILEIKCEEDTAALAY
jgi:hypothetical protein